MNEELVMNRLILVLLFGLAAPASTFHICHDRMNIILPKIVIPGQRITALVHFHDKDVQHNVTLRLIRPEEEFHTDVLAQNTVAIEGSGVVWLNVPSQQNGIYEIQALLDCTPIDQNYSLQTSSKVKLTGSIRDVIIRATSNYYRPGETITFWIMAIDQLLHAPSAALASLYVRDSNGLPQAVWEDVPLFEGTKEFQIPISERAALGKWTIEVRSEGNLYSSELNISLARGSSNQLPNREQVVTEKHFVELHFSDKMRRKYKPGLPLMGKVEAVTSEKEVRVRVKVIDEQLTILYSQDIDMNGREGTFIVPAVITNTPEIIVQAELISLGGKDVDSRYVLARETLRKWNSDKNCYLLIKDLSEDLKPDEEAEMTVLTSCPCSGDMHYVITTEGNIVSRGKLTLTNRTNVPVTFDSIMQGVNIYEFNISFSVQSEMAPTSSLLVYYTTNTGEIIGDSVRFSVRLQHEKVNLIVNENNLWYLGEKIKVGISSFPKTHVCLVGGRRDDAPFRHRQVSPLEHQFLQDDLSFPTSCRKEEETFEYPVHESYFPNSLINQVWLWECFNYTQEIEVNGLTLPPTNGPGKWKLWALSLSDTIELRISNPVTINVFSPINVNFELPATLKVMEIVQVEITITSNTNSCIDIHALIALSEGVVYPGIDMSIVSEKLRLGGLGATSIVVRIQPVTSGLKTMTANVSCYVHESCQETSNPEENADMKIPITTVITHSENLEVISEGIEKVYTESAYFCANEEFLTLESRSTRFKFIPAPMKKYSLIFDIMAADNFHIALAERENSTKNIYQIYLGDFENTVSWIGRGKHNYEVHLTSAQTPNILSAVKYKTFWLNWENSVINIGKGSIFGQDSFLTHIMDRKMRVNLVGFATSFGVEGRVRISEHNDESGYSQVLRLDIPHHILSGSEKGTLYIAGGLALPFALRYMKPIPTSYPFSSLEATLSSLTSVLLMDEIMSDSNWLHSDYNRSYVYDLTQVNLQNLLSYMRKDFSFSDHANITDFTSTIRAYEILSRAQYYWKIDSSLLEEIKKWIVARQHDDGHFEGTTLEDKIVLVAETVAVFLEVGFDDEIDEKMISRGKQFLVDNINHVNETYPLSVMAYTLTLLKMDNVDSLLSRMHIPLITNEKENGAWQNSRSSSVSSPFDWLYNKDKRISDADKRNLIANLVTTDYKATLYTALVHILRKDLKNAESIVKYIFYKSSILDKHAEVAYLTSKTLRSFVSISRNVHPSLTISLATSGMELTDTLELKSDNTLRILDLPSLPTKVFIYATGAGCATVQSRLSYLTYDTESAHYFNFVSRIEEEIPAHYNVVGDPEGLYPQLVLSSCFRLENQLEDFRMEAVLFSGYKLSSIISVSPSNVLLNYGSAGEKIWFVFSNVSANCGICVRYCIESCFIISSLRPIFFRLYAIKNPQVVQELFIHSLNKDSILRTDITDAHFVTWFGSQTEHNELPDDVSSFQDCDSSNKTTNILQIASSINKMIVDVDKFKIEENTSSAMVEFTSHQTITRVESTTSLYPDTTLIDHSSYDIADLPLSSNRRETYSFIKEVNTLQPITEHNINVQTVFETNKKRKQSLVNSTYHIIHKSKTKLKLFKNMNFMRHPVSYNLINRTTKVDGKSKLNLTQQEKQAILRQINGPVTSTEAYSPLKTTEYTVGKSMDKVIVGQNEIVIDLYSNLTTKPNSVIEQTLNQKKLTTPSLL